MNLNYIFFPAPKCSYTPQTLKDELIWIPKYKDGIDYPPEENTKLVTDYHIRTQHFDASEKKFQNKIVIKSRLTKDFTERLSASPNKLPKKITLTEIVNPVNIPNTPLLTPRLSFSFSTEVNPTIWKDESGIIQDESITLNINNTIQNSNLPKPHRRINFSHDYKSPTTNDGSLMLEQKLYPINPSALKKFKFLKDFVKGSKTTRKNGEKDFENIFPENDVLDHICSPKVFTKINIKSLKSMNSETKICDKNRYEKSLTKSSNSNPICKTTPNLAKSLDTEIASIYHKKEINSGVSKDNDANFHFSPKKLNKSLNTIANVSKKDKIEYYIPCLLLKTGIKTRKIIVYFHGNGEDINLAHDLLNHLKINLNVFIFDKNIFNLIIDKCSCC